MASSDTLRCYHKMVPLVNSELSLIHFGTFLTSNTTQVQRADFWTYQWWFRFFKMTQCSLIFCWWVWFQTVLPSPLVANDMMTIARYCLMLTNQQGPSQFIQSSTTSHTAVTHAIRVTQWIVTRENVVPNPTMNKDSLLIYLNKDLHFCHF